MAFELLKGKLSHYRRGTGRAQFMITEREQGWMGATAIGASLAGLAGPAIGLAQSAADMTEEAHHLSFEIDGKVVSGWVWRAPSLRNGDRVEVVAEWQRDHYELVAITKPADRLIALYPHCSRGTKAHWRNAWKWWRHGSLIAIVCMLLFLELISLIGYGESTLFSSKGWAVIGLAFCLFYPLFGIIVWGLGKRWMPMVRLAETVFKNLGWEHPAEIDLPKISKRNQLPDDPWEQGHLYFRY